jgi:hypothetical protein
MAAPQQAASMSPLGAARRQAVMRQFVVAGGASRNFRQEVCVPRWGVAAWTAVSSAFRDVVAALTAS